MPSEEQAAEHDTELGGAPTEVVLTVAEYARELTAPADEAERVRLGVALVVELLDACDAAGVTMIEKGRLTTTAPTSEFVAQGDVLQYELQEGPCVDTVLTQSTVISDNVRLDRRWPRWGPAVAEQLGVGSMLSLLLYTQDSSYGALNLYSFETGSFTSDDVVVAHALAAHLAAALADGRRLDNRAAALINRTVIGQAEGILMERHKITADAAFDMLRRASQRANRKLVAIAQELTRTGELP
jgi:GAF domain-containing protein